MSNFVEKIGKTVDEAVKMALQELNTTEENVEIEVLEEPTKGLLGIGAKPALVRVSVKEEKVTVEENKVDKVNEVISNITSCLGLNIKSNVEDTTDALKVNLEGENLGLIIGYKGETLDALQLLTNVIINKNGEYKLNSDGVYEYVGLGVDGGKYQYGCTGTVANDSNYGAGRPVINSSTGQSTSIDNTKNSSSIHWCELYADDYRIDATGKGDYKITPYNDSNPKGLYQQDVRLGTESLFFNTSVEK